MDKDSNLFKKVSFADLMEHVYKSSKRKDKKLEMMLNTVSGMVNNVQDAAVLLPIFSEIFNSGVKNDDMVVKLAAIVQRYLAVENKGGDIENAGGSYFISQEDKAKIMQEVESYNSETKDLEESLETQLVRLRGNERKRGNIVPKLKIDEKSGS